MISGNAAAPCRRKCRRRRTKATMKRQAKTETELLDHVTNNLLRAVKQKILKKEGRVDYDKLRKEGYNDRLLARLAAAA